MGSDFEGRNGENFAKNIRESLMEQGSEGVYARINISAISSPPRA